MVKSSLDIVNFGKCNKISKFFYFVAKFCVICREKKYYFVTQSYLKMANTFAYEDKIAMGSDFAHVIMALANCEYNIAILDNKTPEIARCLALQVIADKLALLGIFCA